MSAKRYSGDLAITVTYRDAQDDYRVTISWASNPRSQWAKKHRHTVYVKRPLVGGSGVGVDSPEAFDEVAGSAISFADDELEGENLGERAAISDSGWLIARTESRKWMGLPEKKRRSR